MTVIPSSVCHSVTSDCHRGIGIFCRHLCHNLFVFSLSALSFPNSFQLFPLSLSLHTGDIGSHLGLSNLRRNDISTDSPLSIDHSMISEKLHNHRHAQCNETAEWSNPNEKIHRPL